MTRSRSGYELYYWPQIQGRGEFVRLALEDAGAPYRDVAREPGGMKALERVLRGQGQTATLPFAPPILCSGKLVIAQTALILDYLGPRLGLTPAADAGRIAVLQHQLTIADFAMEAHDTHHPIGVELYYEDQKPEAKRRSELFIAKRMPKFLGYFERALASNRTGHYLLGRACSYADLSLFQLVAGLRFAFPNGLKSMQRKFPRIMNLAARVAERPRLAAYLSSERRIAFNAHGLFRHYPELDLAPATKRTRSK